MNRSRNNLPAVIALILIGVGVYLFNLHGPLFWDDADWILNNFSVHALTWSNLKFIFSHDVLAGIGQVSNYYRPFLFLTFLANWLISGSNPVSYHLVSDAIHIANAILVFYLLSRWLKSKRAAFLAALLFLIQPLQTEAVAYVSGRGDPLSILFILLGITAFVNFKNRRRKAYFWASICMVLAVLSRETAVLFPVYLGICLFAFEKPAALSEAMETQPVAGSRRYNSETAENRLGDFRGGRPLGRPDPAAGGLLADLIKILKQVWPFISIAAIYGVLRLTVLNFQNTLNFYQQQNIYSEHLSYRIYTFLHALVVYFWLVFWPTGLHMDRDIPVNTSLFVGYAWLGALIIISFLGWLIYLYSEQITLSEAMADRPNAFSVWFFGLGIFFVNLGPTSGIVPINARIYEHWLYFSLFGLFAIVGWYLDRLLFWFEKNRPKLKPAFIVILIAYCIFLGVQTIRRNLLWTNIEGLYQNILAYEPQDVRVLNNLANYYSDQGDDSDAAPLYEKAIQADPTQPAPYYNLGNIAQNAGQFDQAEALYKKVIQVSPSFYYAYGNLAVLYVNEKKYAQALAELEQLQQIYPTAQTAANIETLKKLVNQ